MRTSCLDGNLWLIMLAAAFFGLFIGAVPGLTATMAVALLVPFTFWLDPLPALAAIVTISACAIFAGDIPAILLRIPGTPASAAYVDDAYKLTQQGRGNLALGIALIFSVVGGLFGSVVLILVGHQLAARRRLVQRRRVLLAVSLGSELRRDRRAWKPAQGGAGAVVGPAAFDGRA